MCHTQALLPWGVVLANRMRSVPQAKGGAWFRMHKYLQSTGWFLQIVGFIFAVVYAEVYADHFTQNHTYIGMTVVAIGTLQPLNALFRAHPPTGGWPHGKKPAKRVVWELVHKGLGWVAVILGIVNIALGLELAEKKGYSLAIVGVGAAFTAIALIPAALFFFSGVAVSPQPAGAACLSLWREKGEAKKGGSAGPEADHRPASEPSKAAPTRQLHTV